MSEKKFHSCALALTALTALSLGCMSASAQSSMSIYGMLDITLGSYQVSGTEGSAANTHTTKVDGNQMVTSFIGFKGTEDLGGGMKAGFALETFLRPDTGASGRSNADVYWGRASNVWLQSSLGKLTIGRQGNLLFGQVVGFNPLGGAFGFSPAVRLTYGAWGNDRGDSGWSNAVSYNTPTMAGVTLTAQVQAGESSTKSERSSYALGASYAAGPFSLALGWQTVRSAEAPKDPSTWPVGWRQTFGLASASYDAGFAKLFGQYGQYEDRGFAANSMLTSLYQVGVSIPMTTNGKLLTSVGQSKERAIDAGTVPKVKHTISTIAYDHWLSKRTDVYAAVMADKEDRANYKSGYSYAVGVRHAF